jgi:hypothetical protein
MVYCSLATVSTDNPSIYITLDGTLNYSTGLLDFVHHPEFYITRKHNVLETGSGPVIEISSF